MRHVRTADGIPDNQNDQQPIISLPALLKFPIIAIFIIFQAQIMITIKVHVHEK
jgi:hypothetical protein